MRIINKKYLLIILLVGVIITGVIFLRSNKEIKLDNVILKQEVNNNTFAMYKETDSGYEEYKETKFPDMYVLNIEMSKCIDNNGNELEDVLSYENDKVTITSGNTTYCYLYFDKSLGLEIKETNPNRLSTDKIRGAMFRFQGQANDDVQNYICFGTSDQAQCKSDTDKYMYRIIGIEAETGRVKVIKKETLKDQISWADSDQENIKFPNSNIYNSINGSNFLQNEDYIPNGWKDKISDNTWTYGDMMSNNFLGARQTPEELYKVETGKKETIWDERANAEDEGAQSVVVGNPESSLQGQQLYYIEHTNETWKETFKGKLSLMYLSDYYYSVSDDVNCQYDQDSYEICRTGWMHLSQNEESMSLKHEWTMLRIGWYPWGGWFLGHVVYSNGYADNIHLSSNLFVRPIFFIDASEELLDGKGTITDPFIIN